MPLSLVALSIFTKVTTTSVPSLYIGSNSKNSFTYVTKFERFSTKKLQFIAKRPAKQKRKYFYIGAY